MLGGPETSRDTVESIDKVGDDLYKNYGLALHMRIDTADSLVYKSSCSDYLKAVFFPEGTSLLLIVNTYSIRILPHVFQASWKKCTNIPGLILLHGHVDVHLHVPRPGVSVEESELSELKSLLR